MTLDEALARHNRAVNKTIDGITVIKTTYGLQFYTVNVPGASSLYPDASSLGSDEVFTEEVNPNYDPNAWEPLQ